MIALRYKWGVFCLFLGIMSFSQKMTPEEYIESYKESAIQEMKLSGVPASITLSQGMLESGNGNSQLATKANNHFGIKCHSSWTGKSIKIDDDKKNECFRKYNSVYDSYKDHSDFLKTRSRYASLFELKITDYKGWARGLKKAGYATNPKYPELLINIIERHELFQYDNGYTKPVHKADEDIIADQIVVNTGAHQVFLSTNKVKYAVVEEGDTYYSFEKEFDVRINTLRRYNDMSKKEILQLGQRVYIQPKRRKANEEFHFMAGETLWEVSQIHGIKLKRIYKLNLIDANKPIEEGLKLHLRKKKRF